MWQAGSMTDHYAVIGNPIKHSKSPLIHSEFAKQTQQQLDYIAKEIPLDGLKVGLKQLAANGLKGINVTVPFKEQIWQEIEDKSPQATLAGAVNTVSFRQDGSLYGDNTDGIGLCRDLTDNHQIDLQDKRILLLGAGGAARGVIQPLLAHKPSQLIVANRTISKAQHLAELFEHLGPIQGGGFTALKDSFDLIINATAASLQGEVPPLPAAILAKQGVCYDMMYSDTDTAFITWAKQQHASKAIDGLGMLVEQAAEAFYIWRGVQPDTKQVIEKLRPTA
jgi:shikimate dehydrogenase